MGTIKNEAEFTISQTKRVTSEGAEKWLWVEVPVLDHGNIMLVDYMGADVSIEQAARVSYGSGTRKVSETEGLIRYLLRHSHTTPFEMIEVKFACRMPMFVARQWIRHRTANVNEYSARYSVVKDTFYVPADEVIQLQSTDNKQGRGQQADDEARTKVREFIVMDARSAYQHYEEMLELGVARELARSNLPVGYYTEWYWKIDLHNLMHFLRLRLDPHAQYEVRVYAEAMAKVVAEAFPIAWQAFVDYELEATKFTRLDMEVARKIGPQMSLPQLAQAFRDAGVTNQRERLEGVDKLAGLNLLIPGDGTAWDDYQQILGLTERQASRELTGLLTHNLVLQEE